jgi:ankyrin repeat protein
VTEKTHRLETPLFLAASSGHHDVVFFLVKTASLTLNAPDIDGNTPLQGAAHASHPEAVSALIEAGADIHLTDSLGNSALHYACWVGCAAAVRSLLSAGADPRCKNDEDTYPLHYAAQGNVTSLVGLEHLSHHISN